MSKPAIFNRRASFCFDRALQLLLPLFLYLLMVSLPGIAAAPEEEADLAKEFQLTLDALQKQYGFPGATAAYILANGTIGLAATGVADMETTTAMTVNSRMLPASIGKTFVAATAVALAQEGILDLDTPVSQWLGEQKWFSRLPNHNVITLRQLLNHSSGLPDYVHLESFSKAVSRKWRDNDNPFPPEDLLCFVLDLPPLFEAGKAWAYSDSGYILIGLVIEKATGRSYYNEIKERFLKPLSLTLTTPADSRFLPGIVAGYMAADNAFGFPRKTTTADGAMVWHPGFEWTGGGLVSNSRDLVFWGKALFEGHAMSGPYLAELLKSVAISPDTPDIQYGLGVGIYRTGPFGPVYGHGGWIPGYSSSLRYYPDHGTAIAFQINTDIGIAENTNNLMHTMESQLAGLVISANNRVKAAE
ncbi:MAG: class A beta-lactamase-related serine hydrolase [Proteobacteria bacterium]|nr:MAG: class A beta-lactamase-related serine hydrolase [Pseudomonadota bacterium]